MRTFGILTAATLLGLLLALLLVEPNLAGTRNGTMPRGALSACEPQLCENAARPRAPAVSRATFSR
jgi:hypothetical protein